MLYRQLYYIVPGRKPAWNLKSTCIIDRTISSNRLSSTYIINGCCKKIQANITAIVGYINKIVRAGL